MSQSESTFGVVLGQRRVGTLHKRGDHTRFAFDEEYLTDPHRPVLGLAFEQDLARAHTANLRLPPWFSNLLPEGVQRKWIAEDRQVSPDREMELLAQVGHDLPGAVRVVALDEPVPIEGWEGLDDETDDSTSNWRHLKMSLAGVGLKYSMVARGDRLALPASGLGGDWIVKLPDPQFPGVPHNEYAMMLLAAAVGIDVPEVRLVHRDQVDPQIPDNLWAGEDWSYAVRRFDRDAQRSAIHIEDLAQVRNVYPRDKYQGNFETVAAFVYRRRDEASLREFCRRLAFNVLIGNGDAHLKNWSLIYRDRRIPSLAPAYDLVSTSWYMEREGSQEDLGLKFDGSRRFDRVGLQSFAKLTRRIGASHIDVVHDVIQIANQTYERWPEYSELLLSIPEVRVSVTESIKIRRKSLMK